MLPKDVQLCQDIASGVDSLGQYQWGDLVQLDPQTVGIIVRLEKEAFQVLNMHSRVCFSGVTVVACSFANFLHELII